MTMDMLCDLCGCHARRTRKTEKGLTQLGMEIRLGVEIKCAALSRKENAAHDFDRQKSSYKITSACQFPSLKSETPLTVKASNPIEDSGVGTTTRALQQETDY